MKYVGLCAFGLLVFQFLLCNSDPLDILFTDNEHYDDNANYEDFEFDFEDYDYDFLNVKKSTCKHPGAIQHGKVEIWGDDLLIDYTCDDGFTPHGVTHGACDVRNKVWTIEPVVCISSDCNFLLPPRKGIVSMDNNQGVASITCEQGLHLIGSPVLYCQEGKWVGDFPMCAQPSELENHSGLNVTEEERLHKKFVELSDESCFHYHIEPPKILYSLVITSYIMNTKRKRYVMVARYSCVNGYRLLNGNAAYLYCKNSKWTAEIMPKCILDNDPCEIENGGCDHNCVFYRKTNKYTCTCKLGYTLGSDKKQCVDINECFVQNAGCQQLCINTQGSYTCSCNRGYITNGTQCTDIDECETSKNVCPGPCINRPGNFKCNCKIKGYRSSSKPYFCQDVDECKKKNGKCDDVCENTRGSYNCRCETRGWKLGIDNHTCVDVNECQRYNGKVCLHGDCINSIGSYRCVCNSGFKPAARDRFCQDLNECDVDNGGCEDECINTDGSYYCNCSKPGYKRASNGFHCIDIDECKNDNGGCVGSCINLKGSYKCSCPNVGEVLAEDGLSCKECSDDEVYNKKFKKCVKCPENAKTKPNVLMPLSDEDCVCKEGFEGNPALLVPCIDVDECAKGLLTCQFLCVNTEGSAHCICPKGFKWLDAKKVCRDINECENDNGGCSQTCKNIQGSYRCSCDTGYKLDSDKHSCNDIDECLLPKTKCPHKCLNLNGSYTCTCQDGYQYNERGDKCEDINECKAEEPPCNQSCTNIPGSYLCNCDGPGFKLSWDNTACIDINECMEGNNPCGESCQNTIGSFKCECNKNGYTASENGLKCRDINECELNDTKVCDQLCINLPGTYRCSCHPGHRRAGSKCIPCIKGFYRGVRDKDCRRCPYHSLTPEIGATSKVECVCRDGYKGDPSRDLKCEDRDECAVNNNDCSHRCVNTAGGAYCTCRTGFQLDLDRKTCIDVDECKTGNGGCEQMCFNQPGSFSCSCRTEFELASNNRSCRDINECLNENHRCEHRCVNIRGGYKCGCHNGYKLTSDNTTCEDINECETNNGQCTDKCINSIGSYECKCNIPGFQLYGDGKQCVDIDECADENLCEDQCENTYGSYKCLCNGNVNLSADAHTCDDFDECSDNATHTCDQICINLRGTYRCDCYPGYYKSGPRCRKCPKNAYRDSTMSVSTCLRCPTRAETPGPGGSSISDCKCIQGYVITSPDSKECTDINECGEEYFNISRCEQKCNNLPGSYFCSCARGQRLLADRKSCNAKINCKPLKRQRKTLVWPPDCVTSGRRRLTPGFLCSTRCYQGYIMEGSRLRTCLPNGKFSGTEPKCTLARCKGLKKVSNGKLYPPRCRGKSVPFGVRCRIKCARGFELKGRVGTKCRATQKWSHRLRTRCVPISTKNTTT